MNKELLKQAQENLAIQDVYLHSSEIKAQDDFYPFAGLRALTVQFKHYIRDSHPLTLAEKKESRQVIRFRYATAFRVLRPGVKAEELTGDAEAPEKTLVEVTANFAAIYQALNEIPKEAINEFARLNVGYHVWPYWREYASSTATRLRLPAFAVPMYHIPSDVEK